MNGKTAAEIEQEKAAIIAQARMRLELEHSFGVEMIPFSAENVGKHRRLNAEREREKRRKQKLTPAQKATELEKLLRKTQRCLHCAIGRDRLKLVFGDGRADADLMFIGEAPGEEEDRQGVPFVGRAGQLLTKIIEAMGLARADVYIANIVKCRPPNNRYPKPEEIAVCLPMLRRQIEIIQPKIIVTLGNLATQTLLETTVGITRTRGIFVQRGDILYLPTFHPSYLLRNPPAKKEVWDDMKKVWSKMKEMGLKIGELKTGRS